MRHNSETAQRLTLAPSRRVEAERWLHARAKELLGADYARFSYEMGEPGRRPSLETLRELAQAEGLLVPGALAEELRALSGLPTRCAGFVRTYRLGRHACFTRVAEGSSVSPDRGLGQSAGPNRSSFVGGSPVSAESSSLPRHESFLAFRLIGWSPEGWKPAGLRRQEEALEELRLVLPEGGALSQRILARTHGDGARGVVLALLVKVPHLGIRGEGAVREFLDGLALVLRKGLPHFDLEPVDDPKLFWELLAGPESLTSASALQCLPAPLLEGGAPFDSGRLAHVLLLGKHAGDCLFALTLHPCDPRDSAGGDRGERERGERSEGEGESPSGPLCWTLQLQLFTQARLRAGLVQQLLFPLRRRVIGADLRALGLASARDRAKTLSQAASAGCLTAKQAGRAFALPVPDEPHDLPSYPRRAPRLPSLPDSAPREGLRIGVAQRGGEEVAAWLPADALHTHVHVVGSSGSGKSTLLRSLIRSEVKRAKRGATFVFDDHGQLAGDVLSDLSRELRESGRVILIDTEDPLHTFGWNFLLADGLGGRAERVGIYRQVLEDESTSTHTGGPLLWEVLTQAANLVGSVPVSSVGRSGSGALTDLSRALRSPEVAEALTKRSTLPKQQRELACETLTKLHKRTDDGANYWTARVSIFDNDPVLQRILGQRSAAVDWHGLLRADLPVVVVVNLAGLSDPGKRVLGTLLFATLLAEAKRRPRTARATLFCDEFQNYLVGSNEDQGRALSRTLSEGRKFGLGCVLAHQNLVQLRKGLQEAISANTGTAVAMRCGEREARKLARRMSGVSEADLLRLPPFRGYVSGTFAGASHEFAFETKPCQSLASEEATAIRASLRARSGVPNALLDRELKVPLESAARLRQAERRKPGSPFDNL